MSESCSIAWLIGCRLVFTPFTKQCGAAFDSTATRLNQVRLGEISVKPNRECHPSLVSPATLIRFYDSRSTYFCNAQRVRSTEPEWKSRNCQEHKLPLPLKSGRYHHALPVKFEAVGQTEGSLKEIIAPQQDSTTLARTSTLLLGCTQAAGPATLFPYRANGWNKIPTIVVLGRERDPRNQLVNDAVDFWNEQLAEMGRVSGWDRLGL